MDIGGYFMAFSVLSACAGIAAGTVHEQPCLIVNREFCHFISDFYILLLLRAESDAVYQKMCDMVSIHPVRKKGTMAVFMPVFFLGAASGVLYEHNRDSCGFTW